MRSNKSMNESIMYFKLVHNDLIIVSLYVHCLLVIGNDGLIEQFKSQMMQAFKITDLGEMTFFLHRTQHGIFF